MILRVKQISQIGNFRDFKSGGSIPFADDKKITLVHAWNTLGKTTFTCVLDSLGNNLPAHIKSRKSIPAANGIKQEVVLSFRALDGLEKTVKYATDKWDTSELQGKILVFDQDFINTHVMLGNQITRDNKEVFTDFILGSKGVALSQKIENDKKTLRTEKNRLDDFRPPFVAGTPQQDVVDSFVALEVTEDTPTLQKLIEADEKRLRRLEKIGEFKHLTEPVIENKSAENEVIKLQQEFTKILKEDYKKVSDEASQILTDHIQSNCNSDTSISWLKQGVGLAQGKQCPFCAQDLDGAKTLIDAFKSIFDEQFEAYEADIKQRIRGLDSDLRYSTAVSYVAPINGFLKQAQQYNPFIPELEVEIQSIENETKSLVLLEQEFQIALASWSSDAQDLLTIKAASSHKQLRDSTAHGDVTEKAKLVSEKLAVIRKIQQNINGHIKNTRNQIDKLSAEQVAEEIEKIQKRTVSNSRKVARLAQDKECTIYKAKLENIGKLQKRVADQILQLETEQTAYLNEYFDRVDYWFKQLGSNQGFKIKKDTTDRGDKKIYTLSVEFHKQKISPADLGKVFSESDKRNLALAIFLSRAEKLTNKGEYILVFDDPVVSFDDNRKRKTCRELEILSNDFRQIIVTTHYSSLVKFFVEMNMPAQYVEISNDGTTSVFSTFNAEEFALSPHQLQCDHILQYIDGVRSEMDKDLRPFMENHLHIRFQQQLAREEIGRIDLGDLIDKLNELGLVSDANKPKLHGFRKTFNPDHHKDGEIVNEQEMRNEARDLIDLLYGELT